MNIRGAMLKAADHIAANPSDFQFAAIYRPDCGTPGCALGWIGHFLNVRNDSYYPGRVAAACGLVASSDDDLHYSAHLEVENAFYERMNALGEADWKGDAAICARFLRLYADKYHPAPKLGIPESVRAIFTAPAIEPVSLVEGSSNG